MRTNRMWQGVRLRDLEVGADPDAETRCVTIPAAWDDGAAVALAALAPGEGAVCLTEAAERWIRPLAEDAAQAGLMLPLADRLHALLLRRRGAPLECVWQDVADAAPGFVLNLSAFVHPTQGFDVDAFAEAVETATTALALFAQSHPVSGQGAGQGGARQLRLGMADLAGLLAGLGIPYASAEARGIAACLAALLRGRADLASATLPMLSPTFPQDWPAPPPACALPGLAAAARQAHALASAPRHRATTAILPPGAADALLGVETGGIAPAFAPLDGDGRLSRTAERWLAARGHTPERALAMLLAGDTPFPEVGAAARTAMHDAVAPFVQDIPAPAPMPAMPDQARHRAMPARRGGYTQKAVVGGHKLYLRTGEYDDGQLGEVSVTVPKDGAAAKALTDALCAAVSVGLQHGVPLESYVSLFTNTRFGAAGAVEGDPLVTQASSVLDYAIRHLAANYLGQRDLPRPQESTEEAAPVREAAPLLPLDLPHGRRLRLVGE